jgi:hypothetical protein
MVEDSLLPSLYPNSLVFVISTKAIEAPVSTKKYTDLPFTFKGSNNLLFTTLIY